MTRLSCSLVLLLFLSGSLWGSGLPTAAPEDVGMSTERLQRLKQVMQEYVDNARMAGSVVLVARKGQTVFLETVGMQDVEAGISLRPDTIMRIASMTKAVTTISAMMLYEQGLFQLNDPVSEYIPEFSNMKVFVEESDSGDVSIVDADGPITIFHLLTHTSGISYGLEREYVGEAYQKAEVGGGLAMQEGTLAQAMKRLAGVPLVHQPGDRWTYGFSTDLLGYLVEVLSGQTLESFFEDHVLGPLEMNDTHFYLPASKVDRFAALYGYLPEEGLTRHPDELLDIGGLKFSPHHPYAGPKTYFSGGGGLNSTIQNYARLLQMLLNDGELDGVRLLSRKTVELMTADHLSERNGGFGLGFSVMRDVVNSGRLGSPGAYGWGSAFYGTYFVDPEERLVAIALGQLLPAVGVDLLERFPNLVYQSITD